jgi:hypothetical protein
MDCFVLGDGSFGHIIETPSGRKLPAYGEAWTEVFTPSPVSAVERRAQVEFGVFEPSLWPVRVAGREERFLDDLSELTAISPKEFERARKRGWQPPMTPKVGDHFLICSGLGQLTFGVIADPLEDFTPEERDQPREWDPGAMASLNDADRTLRAYSPHVHRVHLFAPAEPEGQLERWFDDQQITLMLTATEFEAARRRGWHSAHLAPPPVLEEEVRLFQRLQATERSPHEWRPFAPTFAAFLTRTRLADPERYAAFDDAMARQEGISTQLAFRLGVTGTIDLFGTRRRTAAAAGRASKARPHKERRSQCA